MIQEFKENVMKTFEMTDLGLMHCFLGIEINQQEEGMLISQKKYAESVLKKFKMNYCKNVPMPLVTNRKLQKEDRAEKADVSLYRSLISPISHCHMTRHHACYKPTITLHAESRHKHFGAIKKVLWYL